MELAGVAHRAALSTAMPSQTNEGRSSNPYSLLCRALAGFARWCLHSRNAWSLQHRRSALWCPWHQLIAWPAPLIASCSIGCHIFCVASVPASGRVAMQMQLDWQENLPLLQLLAAIFWLGVPKFCIQTTRTLLKKSSISAESSRRDTSKSEVFSVLGALACTHDLLKVRPK